MATADGDGRKLNEVFDDIWNIYKFMDNTEEPTISNDVQEKISCGSKDAEIAVHRVNLLRLFSDNESMEEVSTEDIRYLLLPALLGYFMLKITKGDRMETVKKAEVYFNDYLRLCRNYGVTNVDLSAADEDTDGAAKPKPRPQLDREMQEKLRRNKIQRYKQQKETETRLNELYTYVNQEHVEDEVKRDYYSTLLTKWVNVAVEEIEGIQAELQILEHMAAMRDSGKEPPKPQPSKSKSLRPFILTKNTLQKQVFGLGYPSIPTVTVDEFFEQKLELGQLSENKGMSPAQAMANDPEKETARQEQEDVEKEEKLERDDPEALQQARNWEEWRDDHRRGWGNTHNKG